MPRMLLAVLAAALIWIALRSSATPATILTGLGLGLLVAALGGADRGRVGPPLRVAGALLRLAGAFALELVVANLVQLRLVFSPRLELRPCWLRFRTRLRGGRARAVLSILVSMTPGTIACAMDEEGEGIFVIHALDVADEQRAVARLRRLFEQPLLVLEGSDG